MDETIQMKVIEQYFHKELFVSRYFSNWNFHFFLNIISAHINFVFGDEVYTLVPTTNSISLIADSRTTNSERLYGNSRDLDRIHSEFTTKQTHSTYDITYIRLRDYDKMLYLRGM